MRSRVYETIAARSTSTRSAEDTVGVRARVRTERDSRVGTCGRERGVVLIFTAIGISKGLRRAIGVDRTREAHRAADGFRARRLFKRPNVPETTPVGFCARTFATFAFEEAIEVEAADQPPSRSMVSACARRA